MNSLLDSLFVLFLRVASVLSIVYSSGWVRQVLEISSPSRLELMKLICCCVHFWDSRCYFARCSLFGESVCMIQWLIPMLVRYLSRLCLQCLQHLSSSASASPMSHSSPLRIWLYINSNCPIKNIYPFVSDSTFGSTISKIRNKGLLLIFQKVSFSWTVLIYLLKVMLTAVLREFLDHLYLSCFSELQLVNSSKLWKYCLEAFSSFLTALFCTVAISYFYFLSWLGLLRVWRVFLKLKLSHLLFSSFNKPWPSKANETLKRW